MNRRSALWMTVGSIVLLAGCSSPSSNSIEGLRFGSTVATADLVPSRADQRCVRVNFRDEGPSQDFCDLTRRLERQVLSLDDALAEVSPGYVIGLMEGSRFTFQRP
jgi:hypothetical protein